jgi:hypothetical protein
MGNKAEDQEKTQKDFRCTVCSNVTHHELRFSHTAHFPDDEDYDPAVSDEGPCCWQKREYRVWVCLGCDNARFEILYTLHGYEPDDEELSVFFPEKRREGRSAKQFYEISNDLQAIYKEVISSYNSGLTITCAVGIRALLEGICASKGITDDDAWELERKVKILCERNHAPAGVINALLGLKIMGDVAAHRLGKPRLPELTSAIELIELLLEYMYEVEPLVLERADFVERLTRKRVLDREEEKKARKMSKAQSKQSVQREG